MGYWYNETSEKSNIAVSTRVRLARNLKDIPFPSKMTAEDRKRVNEMVKNAVMSSKNPIVKNFKYISMEDIPENERLAMVERHIISREFASKFAGRSIIISEDETVTIMIGEEDHIRIQVLSSGLSPETAYKKACIIDDILCSNLQIAYDKDFGFLTECPTNIGTGLRASVMLHLPLLQMNGRIPFISESVNKLGFTVRGFYGEGTKPQGSLYQISNQITLGISEKDAIDNLKIIAKGLIEREEKLFSELNKIAIEDKCMRSLYTLMGARILTSKELTECLSYIMLGLNFGIINENGIKPVKLFIEGQPFMLMSKYGNMTPDERDIKRAEMIRNQLKLSVGKE